MSSKTYYDIYNHNTLGVCKICSKPTRFVSISEGYKLTCSPKCAAIYSQNKREQTNLIKYGTKNPAQNNQIRNKISKTIRSEECQNRTKQTAQEKYGCDYVNQSNLIKNKSKETIQVRYNGYSELTKRSQIARSEESDLFELEHNYTRIGKLIDKYGQSWLSIKSNLTVLSHKGCTYILNSDIHKIIEYSENSFHTYSHMEKDLVTYIKSFYSKNMIENSRKIISPLELDIYLPNLNLAIEFNGNFWHSIENGCSKEYHLTKSLLCREKCIRLIHIYEFEDLNKQKQLLKDLILGKDNYPKNDFNKNNLIENILDTEIVYQDKYTIYGAGKLYNN